MIDITDEKLDFAKYQEYISAEDNINFVDADKLDSVLAESEACKNTCESHMSNQLKFIGGGYNTDGTSKQKVMHILINHGVPECLFESRKNESGLGFDAEIQQKVYTYIKEGLFTTDECINLLNYMEYFFEHSKYSSVCSSMRKNMKNGLVVPSDAKTFAGTRLYEMYNSYRRRVTGRYYARDVAIVQLPKKIRKCITVPNNYVMLCLDLQQIDMNVAYNLYLRGVYNDYDEIFDNTDDKYMAMFKIIHLHLGVEPDYEYFKENRAAIKKNILSAMYGAGIKKLMVELSDSRLNTSLVEFFDTHKKYQMFKNKIDRLFELGSSFIVSDYFGFDIDIDLEEVMEKRSYGALEISKIYDLVFARTIQATSNSIKVLWTNYVMDRLKELGIKDTQLWINMDRHDEIDITIHKSVLDKIVPIYEASSIRIADWNPIKFDIEVCIHYEEDEEDLSDEELALVKSYKEQILPNFDKYEKALPKREPKPTNTIPNVHQLYCYSVKTPKELYKEVYNYELETEEECTRELARNAGAGNLPETFRYYPDLKDIYILKNVNTGKEKVYIGRENLTQALATSNIKYLIASTLYGTGYTLIADTFIKVDSINQSDTFDTLRRVKSAIRENT